MTTDNRMTFTPNLVVGLGIAGLGIVLILDRVGLIPAQDVLRFWPVLLILFGASVVAQAIRGGPAEPRRAPIVSPGFIFFIAILGLLFSRGYNRGDVVRGEAGDTTTKMFNVMGQTHRTNTSARFRAADLTNVMGSSILDLREATIAPGTEAVIEVFSMMGKVDLLVPDDWKVEVEAMPVMGTVRDRRFRSQIRIDDQRTPPAEATTADTPAVQAPTPPRVVLRGFVLMGAVVVRS